MGLILCMAGAVGALVSVLAIAVLSLMGKKAGVPLGLFALCAAVMLASGLLPGGSGTERPPRSPGEIRGTPVTSAVRPAARDPESGEDPEPVGTRSPGSPPGAPFRRRISRRWISRRRRPPPPPGRWPPFWSPFCGRATPAAR